MKASSTSGVSTRGLRLHAYPVLGDQPMRILVARPSISQAWVRGITGKSSSVHQIVKDIAAVFAAAVDDQIIARNPVRSRSVTMPKAVKAEIRPWTAEQIAAVAAGLPDRFQAITWLGAGTGMRQGELMAVALDDIDFLRRVVHVRAQIRQTNGGRMFAAVKNHKAHFRSTGRCSSSSRTRCRGSCLEGSP